MKSESAGGFIVQMNVADLAADTDIRHGEVEG